MCNRLFPAGSPLDVDLGSLIRQAEARGDDCKLVKQLFDGCAQPMALSQDSDDGSQRDEAMSEPVLLPAYLGAPPDAINTRY